MNQININLKDADDLECENCGCIYFTQVYRVKKISALFSPTGQETFAPLQMMKCIQCGEIIDELENND